MPELLEVRGVVAGYGRGPAILNGATLTVRPGQVQCIIGPNGAGKSTLLKAIAGLLPIREGEIRFKGERIDGLRPDQILRKGICFVPQERALFPKMTVRENLRMGGYVLHDKREAGRAHRGRCSAVPDPARARARSMPAPCPAASSRCSPWRAR